VVFDSPEPVQTILSQKVCILLLLAHLAIGNVSFLCHLVSVAHHH